MTKDKYISLLQSPLVLIYEYYTEVVKKPVSQMNFIQNVSRLLEEQNRTMPELISHICQTIELEIKLWRVYDTNKQFIGFA